MGGLTSQSSGLVGLRLSFCFLQLYLSVFFPFSNSAFQTRPARLCRRNIAERENFLALTSSPIDVYL